MLNIKDVRTPSFIQHCEDDPRMSISQGTIMQSSTKCFLFKPLFLVVCFWLIAQAGGSGEHRQANTAFVMPVETKVKEVQSAAKDTRIRVSGNAAVVTFHLGGKDSLGRRTIIFEKQKGKWLIVHLHASTMAI